MDHVHRFPDAAKIRAHFRKNKDRYLFFGLGAVVVLAIRKPITIAPVFNNIPIFNNTNAVQFGGYAHKIVKRLEDDAVWETVKDAAKAAKVDAPTMSKHLNGWDGYGDIGQQHYQIIGIGTRS